VFVLLLQKAHNNVGVSGWDGAIPCISKLKASGFSGVAAKKGNPTGEIASSGVEASMGSLQKAFKRRQE